MKSIFTLLLVIFISYSNSIAQVITIAQAVEDLNSDFIPDRLGDTVTVQGVVFTPRFHNVANTYFVDDGTAGTNVYMPAPPTFNWNLGDELQITGVVAQFYGLSEIIALDSSSWILISTGNQMPDPIVLTIAQYFLNPESFEGSLIGFVSLTMVGGVWPSPGNNTTVQISDGIDTLDMRINRYTDVDNNPEPTWPQDIIGIGQQNTSSIPPDDGYQLVPRFYGDFLPPGTLPVEITTFTASTSNGEVILNWITATETNNQGFEIQRKVAESDFATIGFVKGEGTTTNQKDYSFVDKDLVDGKYFYRLKQVDYNGTFEYSDVIEADVRTLGEFVLEQNFPNPFNPITTIRYVLKEKANANLILLNAIGEEIAVLVDEEQEKGFHKVDFNAINLPSGVYFYRLQAGDFVQTRKMILLK